MLIRLTAMNGLEVAQDKRLIDPTRAEVALDCQVREGVIEPTRVAKRITPTLSSEVDAPWLTSAPDRAREHPNFVSGQTHASIALLPTDDIGDNERVLSAVDGSVYYKQGNAAQILAGIGAPNIAMEDGGGTVQTDEPQVERYFVMTEFNEFGQESAPGPVLGPIKMNVNVGSRLLDIPANYVVGAFTTGARVYVSNGSINGAGYFFCAELAARPIPGQTIANVTAATMRDAQVRLVTQDLFPPPFGLTHLKTLASGSVAAIKEASLVYSDPVYQYGFPPNFAIPLEAQPMGIGLLDQTQVVPTDIRPYLVQGTQPGEMFARMTDIPHACKSDRSVCEMPGSVGFASEDGYIVISAAGHENITAQTWTPKQWRKFRPESILAVYFDLQLVLFFDDGAGYRGSLWFSPGSAPVERSVWASGAYVDPYRAKMYFRQGTFIYSSDDIDAQDTGLSYGRDREFSLPTQPLQYLWRSKTFRYSKPNSIGVIQASGQDLSLAVTVIADGRRLTPLTVTANQRRRVPGGFKAYEWAFEFEGSGRLDGFEAATTPKELSRV